MLGVSVAKRPGHQFAAMSDGAMYPRFAKCRNSLPSSKGVHNQQTLVVGVQTAG